MTHVYVPNTSRRSGGTTHEHRTDVRNAPASAAERRHRRRTLAEFRTTAPARAAERPGSAEQPAAPCHQVGRLVVDAGRRRAWVDGLQLRLTCMEFELLAHLAANPDRDFSRARLMELVWQRNAPADLATVDTHIDSLRDKLGATHRPLIRTTPTTGYALASEAPAEAAAPAV
ncbi:winged helix-turn-helix domain-containing protein [Streptomyces sp. NBC_00083]|uniref:winged helix-turn-helix domain-containing protein n=1 Tax=Streptomyces sp. NBC_00083 TaxID=2975647 RepID=UPI00225A0573|nr:winged helix-turn-helix domain-containing protein [Streptomyces sp. NBC_00083]MCX5384647.1 winged helix-turn-helix domain-containing protein [Streptomyces sp. NBC_00083]